VRERSGEERKYSREDSSVQGGQWRTEEKSQAQRRGGEENVARRENSDA
jgi:hypothetical protein